MVEAFESNSDIYLVLENGGINLKKYINNKNNKDSFDIDQHIKLTQLMHKQLFDAVHWIHKQKVCHLDISLENIVINIINNEFSPSLQPSFTLKLIDFGVAQSMEYSSNINNIKGNFYGKLGYVCPEIYYKNDYFNGKKADIHSLGVVFFMIYFETSLWKIPDERKDKIYANMVKNDFRIIKTLNHCYKDRKIYYKDYNNNFELKNMMVLIGKMIHQNEYQRPRLPEILTKYKWINKI